MPTLALAQDSALVFLFVSTVESQSSRRGTPQRPRSGAGGAARRGTLLRGGNPSSTQNPTAVQSQRADTHSHELSCAQQLCEAGSVLIPSTLQAEDLSVPTQVSKLCPGLHRWWETQLDSRLLGGHSSHSLYLGAPSGSPREHLKGTLAPLALGSMLCGDRVPPQHTHGLGGCTVRKRCQGPHLPQVCLLSP